MLTGPLWHAETGAGSRRGGPLGCRALRCGAFGGGVAAAGAGLGEPEGFGAGFDDVAAEREPVHVFIVARTGSTAGIGDLGRGAAEIVAALFSWGDDR